MVHNGFNETWTALQPHVFEALDKYLTRLGHRRMPVYMTGHSSGAAAACLCAYSFRREFPSHPCVVYTFGQTRFANSVFRDLYNAAVPETYRVTLENDVIVHLTHCNRVHVGREVVIDRDGNFIVEPNGIENYYKVLRGVGSGLGNHRLARYAKSLEKIFSTTCPLPFQTFLEVQRKQLLKQRDLSNTAAGGGGGSAAAIGNGSFANNNYVVRVEKSSSFSNDETSSSPATSRVVGHRPKLSSGTMMLSHSVSLSNNQQQDGSPNQQIICANQSFSVSRYQAKLGIVPTSVSPQHASLFFSQGTLNSSLNIIDQQQQQQHKRKFSGSTPTSTILIVQQQQQSSQNENNSNPGHRSKQSSGFISNANQSTNDLSKMSTPPQQQPVVEKNQQHHHHDPFDLIYEKEENFENATTKKNDSTLFVGEVARARRGGGPVTPNNNDNDDDDDDVDSDSSLVQINKKEKETNDDDDQKSNASFNSVQEIMDQEENTNLNQNNNNTLSEMTHTEIPKSEENDDEEEEKKNKRERKEENELEDDLE
jgi:hypothetical protein